jgi:hypothetical protein
VFRIFKGVRAGLLDGADGRIVLTFDCIFFGIKFFVEGSTGFLELILDLAGEVGYSFINVFFGLDGDDVLADISAVFLNEVS